VQIELKNTGKAKQEVVVEDLLWRYHNYTVSPCQPKYASLPTYVPLPSTRLISFVSCVVTGTTTSSRASRS
jgi:hypothetical protein